MSYGYNMFLRYGYGMGSSGYNPLINYKWSTQSIVSDYITDGVDKDVKAFSSTLITDTGTITSLDETFTISANGDGSTSVNSILEWREANDTETVIGDTVKINISVNVTSGTMYYRQTRFAGVNISDGQYTNHTAPFELEFITTALESSTVNQLFLYFGTGSAFEAEVTAVSIEKVIQEPNQTYTKNSGTSKVNALSYGGQGVKFNRADQHIETNLMLATNFTLGAIVDFSATVDGWDIIFSNEIWNNYTGFIIGKINNNFLTFHNAKGSAWKLSSKELNSVYNIKLVFLNGTISLYLDNILDKVTVVPYNTNATKPLLIGSRHSNDGLLYVDCTPAIVKDLYIFNRVLTPTEIAYNYSNPNDFYQDALSDTTCVLNMPMCENDDYVRDMSNYSEGVELIADYSIVDWGSTGTAGTISSSGDGQLSLAVTTTGTTSQQPRVHFNLSSGLVAGNTYLYRFNYTTNSGTPILAHVYDGAITYTITETLDGTATFDYIFKTTADYTAVVLYFDGRNLFDVDMVIEVKQLSGIYPIANPTASCRDDAKNLTYGSQQTNFYKDSFGVRTGLSPYWEMDGTQRPALSVPMTDTELGSRFTIEFVIKRELGDTNYLLNSYDGSKGLIVYTEFYDLGRIYFRLYDGVTYYSLWSTVMDSDYHNYQLEFDGINATIITDGVQRMGITASFVPSGLSFADSTASSPIGTLAMFQIWDEERYDSTYNRDTSVANGQALISKIEGWKDIADIDYGSFDYLATRTEYETDGVELIVNGGFDSDSDWGKGVGWTISNGLLVGDVGAYSSSNQSIVFTEGDTYKVDFEVVSISAGNIAPYFSGGTNVTSAYVTSAGKYTYYMTAVAGNNKFHIASGSVNFVGSIDNVSVQKVIPNTEPNTRYIENIGGL